MKQTVEQKVIMAMTDFQLEQIGMACRNAVDGNLLVGSFAAELVGESYPFSKAMATIVFDKFSNLELGQKFAKWIKEIEA